MRVNKQLTVYKAGAGSGKTFRLAVEYIKLLINAPECYRNILAVTFTNKATEEMKTRILSQLYGIWKLDPDSAPYINRVTKELDVTPEFASRQAHIALTNLIHNYSYFRVETIDSFFQSVLRNLARELELTPNLRIELNDKQVEQKAVDDLIEELQATSLELKWIMSYIRDNIDDDKGWNVIGQLKKFGENIFKDIYRQQGAEVSKKLAEKDFFSAFSTQLRQLKEKARKQLQLPAERFFEVLQEKNLDVSNFSNGASGVCGYFLKLQKGEYNDDKLLGTRVMNALNGPEGWLKKSDLDESSDLYITVTDILIPLLQTSERCRPRQLKLYKSADITLRHLSQLRLLNSIEEKVHQLNTEANRFLLSNTQNLLFSLIRDNDSPFIFEKIGSKLEHIMIDEFQDTSTLQWENFKVLLKECMSHAGSHDIIVGDVKQSIYRWRSGDWRLLNEIENSFDERQLEVIPMNFNRRSSVHVIEFNNTFFTAAARNEYLRINDENPAEAPQLRKAYEKLCQQYPEDRNPQEGYVRIDLLPQANYQEETMRLLTAHIDNLRSLGIPFSSIAILVRSNRTIQAIAEHFIQERPEIRMVSDEAFRIDSSTAVEILVGAMQLLITPDDKLTRATVAKTYQRIVLGNSQPESQLLLSTIDLDSLLPTTFTACMDELAAMPITDLAERLFDIFQLNLLQDQGPYISAFFDLLSKYVKDNIADIDSFLKDWNESLHEKTLHSDDVDGIRLITIHKSKGLEFDHVIMPFCDWTMNKGSLLWCQPSESEEPFSQLSIIPVDYSERQMKGTIFEKEYFHEHLQDTVDNLNLLYVAFTRAKHSLMVMARRGGSNLRSFIIEQCLPEVAKELSGATLEGEAQNKDEVLSFTYGMLEHIEKTDKQSSSQAGSSETANIFTKPSASLPLTIENFPVKAEFRQSNRSRDFIKGTEEEEKSKGYIRLGSILHNIFSTIRTKEDIPAALRQMENEGVLYDDLLSRQKLMELIRKRLESPKVADWFSDRWQLFNECSILFVDKESGKVTERRPDRVMTDGNEIIVVDFKFGHPTEANLADYRRQVSDYMTLLIEMGYTQVSGYLWFVYSNQIIPVNKES